MSNLFVKKKFSLIVLYRWEAINNFLQMHVAESKRTVKEILAKVKDLSKNGKLYFIVGLVLKHFIAVLSHRLFCF